MAPSSLIRGQQNDLQACTFRGRSKLVFEGPFASWAAILIRPAQPIVLLAANSMDAEEAQIRLARVV